MSTVRHPYFFRGSPTPGEISGCGVHAAPRGILWYKEKGFLVQIIVYNMNYCSLKWEKLKND